MAWKIHKEDWDPLVLVAVMVVIAILVAGYHAAVSQARQIKELTRQCEERGGVYLEEEHVCFRGERILLDGEK